MRRRRPTARQLDILDRLARPGATIRSVAEDMGIAEQTAKNALSELYRRLGVQSALQARAALERDVSTEAATG